MRMKINGFWRTSGYLLKKLNYGFIRSLKIDGKEIDVDGFGVSGDFKGKQLREEGGCLVMENAKGFDVRYYIQGYPKAKAFRARKARISYEYGVDFADVEVWR